MTRTGIGYDSHRLVEGRKLVLGGVDIPYLRGLAGHSDADALCHAICDALLGAIGEGDIGTHFPDTDPQWKDAESLILLASVVQKLCVGGWEVNNIDTTIIAQAPQLGPYVSAMREKLAHFLEVDTSRISIKAKTNEGMGAIGRGEGIAVIAVATIKRRKIGGEEE